MPARTLPGRTSKTNGNSAQLAPVSVESIKTKAMIIPRGCLGAPRDSRPRFKAKRSLRGTLFSACRASARNSFPVRRSQSGFCGSQHSTPSLTSYPRKVRVLRLLRAPEFLAARRVRIPQSETVLNQELQRADRNRPGPARIFGAIASSLLTNPRLLRLILRSRAGPRPV